MANNGNRQDSLNRQLETTRPKNESNIHELLNPLEEAPLQVPDIKTKKRKRRRFKEVERYFICDHPNCDKSYGSLAHLNEHRVIQSHGPRKKLEDFGNVKEIMAYRDLQRRILNHETIILDLPSDNQYYNNINYNYMKQQQVFYNQFGQPQFPDSRHSVSSSSSSSSIPTSDQNNQLSFNRNYSSSSAQMSNDTVNTQSYYLSHSSPNQGIQDTGNSNNQIIYTNYSSSSSVANTLTNDTEEGRSHFDNHTLHPDSNQHHNNNVKLPPISKVLSNKNNCSNINSATGPHDPRRNS